MQSIFARLIVLAGVWFPIAYGATTTDWTDRKTVVRCPVNVEPPNVACVVVDMQ